MDFDKAVAYCAGFFDGEGCISLESVKMTEAWHDQHRTAPESRAAYREYRVRIITSQKFSDVPLRIMAETVGGKVHWFPSSGLWQHIANGRTAVSALRLLLPYLTVRRAQAEIAVQWFEMTTEERIEAVTRCRELKKERV